jgi:tetratricopeptide (TPR) repeat protein
MSQVTDSNKGRLFLSYARDDDEPFAKRLFNDLRLRGFDVWWDRASMPNRGLTFLQEIRDAIGASDRLILIVGPDAMQSNYVRAEWEYALKLCKPINPVLRIGDYPMLPRELALLDVSDFRDDSQYTEKLSYFLRQLEEAVPLLGRLHNVPPLPAWYIERTDALGRVAGLLRLDATEPIVSTYAHQIVSLYGPPGIGKTVVGSALAHDCDIRRTFVDGVFWLELGTTPDLVSCQASIGREFGDMPERYHDQEQGKARLAALLSERSALIILDDVWNHQHIDAFRFAAGYRVRYLVVTRGQRLAVHIGGPSYELTNLSINQAVQLIATRMGMDWESFLSFQHRDALFRIAQSLVGHTQAISIAAAQLARRGHDFAPILAKRLETRLRTESPFRDLELSGGEDRQLSLEITLSLSYEDLSEDLKRCFRALGAFVSTGTFDANAVMALLSSESIIDWEKWDSEDAEDKLDTLVDAALVVRHENRRYRLHRVIKFYALAMLKRQDEFEAIFYRFAMYYLMRATQLFSESPDHWDHYDLPQICEVGDFGASRIADTMYYPDILEKLRTISREGAHARNEFVQFLAEKFALISHEFVTTRNTGHQGLCWLLAGLGAARARNSQVSIGRLAVAIGDWYEWRGDVKSAGDYYMQAMEVWRSLDDKANAALVLLRFGNLYRKGHYFTDALKCIEAASKTIEGTDDEMLQAEVWAALGVVHGELGDYEKALESYLKTVEVWNKLDNRAGQAAVLNNIGMAYDGMEKFDQALEYVERAYSLTVLLADERRQATCFVSKGRIFKHKGDEEEAFRSFMQGIYLAESARIDDPELESILHYELALIFWKRGERNAALNALQRVRDIKITVGAPTDSEDALLKEWSSNEAKG